MSYRFIIGEAGSGKTTAGIDYLLKESKENPDKNYFLIVPEQFTLQSQMTLVRLHPGHSVMDIDVLNFTRLAFYVLKEQGKDDFRVLEDSGKNIIIRKLVNDFKDNLEVLGNHTRNMSYVDEIKSLISELMQYGVGPDVLRDFLDTPRASGRFKSKAKDILLIYEKLLEYISGDYITAEMLLDLMLECIDDSKLLEKSTIVFDGFTGFTPLQNKVVEKLLTKATEVVVTVTMDTNLFPFTSIREEELFYMSKNYISQVRNMQGGNVEEKDAILLSGKREPKVKEIYELSDEKSELVFVASRIRDLVREGLRYKDIAIVSGNQSIYAPYIEDVFLDFDIPVFFDDNENVSFHPLAALLKDIIDIVLYDFKAENIIGFLKNPLLKRELNVSWLMDLYLTATGVRGFSAYKKAFRPRPAFLSDEDLEIVDKTREEIFNLFKDFYKKYEKDSVYSVGVISEDIYDFLSVLKVEKELFLLDEIEVFNLLIDHMEKVFALIPDEKMSLKEYVDVLFAGLLNSKIGRLPQSADMVVFGDTVRTRLDDVHTLFVIGANEGVLPSIAGGGGFFSERDRQLLFEEDIHLAPSERERQFAGEFYIYLLLNRPYHNLILTYSTMNTAGESLRPSYIVNRLKKQGVSLKIGEPSVNTKVIAKQTIIGLIKELKETGKVDKKWLATLLSYFKSKYPSEAEDITKRVFSVAPDDELSRTVLRAIDNGNVSISVSRLEAYARCSYAYYLNYILGLKEQVVYGMNSADIGNIYHDSLYNYFTLIKSQGLDIKQIEDKKLDEIIKKAIDLSYEKVASKGDYDNAFEEYVRRKIEDTVKTNIKVLSDQLKKSKFVPTHFEVNLRDICSKKDLEYELSDCKLTLNGKIDRIDLYENEDSVYIEIIDYKSSAKSFDLSKAFYGLQIQLLYYLNAQMKSELRTNPDKRIIPSAVLYYHIDNPRVTLKMGEDIESIYKKIQKELIPKGLICDMENVYKALDSELGDSIENSQAYASNTVPVKLNKGGKLASSSNTISSTDLDYLMDYVQKKALDTAKDIGEGKIQKNPYRDSSSTGCNFCSFHGICSFDIDSNGDKYKDLRSINNMDEFRNQDKLTGDKENKNEL